MKLVSLLRQRVTSRLHLGILHPGDRLPSVRIAAREFDVDPRLVLAAYRDLESDGLVELRARSGVFVASHPALDAAPAKADERGANRRTDWLIDRLAESLAAGIPAPMFVEQTRRSLETLRLRAVVLDRNDDQLWSTADELKRDYGFETDVVDVDRVRRRDALPAVVRRADLLVTASPQAPIRAIAASAGVPLLEISMCPDLFAEVRRLVRTETVYFVVADPRFAVRLDTFLAPPRNKSRLRALVYNRDDLRQIPSTAPVYLTRLAREHMARDGAAHGITDLPLLNRVIPDARVFSAESARQLLAFVVRANVAASATAGEKPPLLPRGRVHRRSAAAK